MGAAASYGWRCPFAWLLCRGMLGVYLGTASVSTWGEAVVRSRCARKSQLAMIAGILACAGGAVTLAACGSGAGSPNDAAEPTTTAAPTTTASPKNAKTPLDWSEAAMYSGTTDDALQEVYQKVAEKGQGVATAADYSGTEHPMMFIGAMWEFMFIVQGDKQVDDLLRPDYVEDVQLVAKVTESTGRTKSCGTFTRGSDNVSGEVTVSAGITTIVIYEAQTGEQVAKKTFTTPPQCPSMLAMLPAHEDPPWDLGAENMQLPDVPIQTWIDSFLRGPART